MLGRKALAGAAGKQKKRKWQESDIEDAKEAEVSKEDLDRWREKMAEEEKEEQLQFENRERELELEKEIAEKSRLEREAFEKRRRAEETREQAERALADGLAPDVAADLVMPLGQQTDAPASIAHLLPRPGVQPGDFLEPIPAPDEDYSGKVGVPAVSVGTGSHEVITASFQIPAAKVCDVLGVRGMNIRSVKQKSGILKITILDRAEPATVSVTGTPSQIEKARQLVLQITRGDQSCVGNATEVVVLEDHLVPRIIGPRGETMKRMKEQTGAYIAVRRGGRRQQVEITGPPQSVIAAKRLVEAFVRQEIELEREERRVAEATEASSSRAASGNAGSQASGGEEPQGRIRLQSGVVPESQLPPSPASVPSREMVAARVAALAAVAGISRPPPTLVAGTQVTPLSSLSPLSAAPAAPAAGAATALASLRPMPLSGLPPSGPVPVELQQWATQQLLLAQHQAREREDV